MEMNKVISDVIKDSMEKQEMWMRAVFIKYLGEKSFGLSDLDLANMAKEEGLKIAFSHDPFKVEIRDKNDDVVSTMTYKMKIDEQ